MARNSLTAKQQRFVAEYLVDLNATQAAIRAGYSAKNAGKIGPELLGKARIAEAISAKTKPRLDRLEVTADRVMRELARIAFADPREVVNWGPAGVVPIESAELTDDQAAAIAEVSETKPGQSGGGSIRIKLHDKLGALKVLAQYTKLLEPDAPATVGPLLIEIRQTSRDPTRGDPAGPETDQGTSSAPAGRGRVTLEI